MNRNIRFLMLLMFMRCVLLIYPTIYDIIEKEISISCVKEIPYSTKNQTPENLLVRRGYLQGLWRGRDRRLLAPPLKPFLMLVHILQLHLNVFILVSYIAPPPPLAFSHKSLLCDAFFLPPPQHTNLLPFKHTHTCYQGMDLQCQY